MAQCGVCGEDVNLPYDCNGCHGHYCSEHRLPENHDCSGLTISQTTNGTARNFSHREKSYTAYIICRFGWPVKAFTSVVLSPAGVAIILTAAAAILLIGPIASISALPMNLTVKEPADRVNNTTVAQKVHHFTNDKRTANNRGQVQWSSELSQIARYHSQQMASKGFFSHTAPNGESFQDRLNKHGYQCRVSNGGKIKTGAENIGKTYADALIEGENGEVHSNEYNESKIAKDIVNQWMTSTGHRKNILDSDWRRQGIGVSLNETEKGDLAVYVTQVFC